MGKWFNYIFFITSEAMWTIFGIYDNLMIVYPVYVFYDQRLFCLIAMATLNFQKDFLKTTPSKLLKQYDSNLVQKLLW